MGTRWLPSLENLRCDLRDFGSECTDDNVGDEVLASDLVLKRSFRLLIKSISSGSSCCKCLKRLFLFFPSNKDNMGVKVQRKNLVILSILRT